MCMLSFLGVLPRQLDKLVKNRYFTSRCEALRYAIKKLLAENNYV
ncbi:MAG: ribbon-helix-helix domain-containing protein [Candidatus Baldrarchaeia archaeon]